MAALAKSALALGLLGTVAVAGPTPTLAQGVYLEGPGVEFGVGPRWHHRYYRDYGYDRPHVYGRPYGERYYHRRHWDWD